MKHLLRLTALGLIFLTGLSCSESKYLQKGLSRFPQPLGYELNSPTALNPKTDSLIVTYRGFPMDSLTTVHREKSLILPFLFFNYLNFKYHVKLGANLMEQDFNDFFFEALLDESQRSGQFALCYDSTRRKDAYCMEVSLDTCDVSSFYEEEQWVIYYIYGYVFSYNEAAWPSTANIACKIKLSKGEQLLKDTTISVSKKLVFPGGGNQNRSEMLNLLAGNMVESLCQSTQRCLANVVQEVNATLKSQKH
jgi:hypothetical protein